MSPREELVALELAIEHVLLAVKIAYENGGLHEFGYDPVEVLAIAARRYNAARSRAFGVADWTEHAKPLVRYQASADDRLDKFIETQRKLT